MLSGFVPAEGYKENAEQVNLPGLGAQRICDAGPFGDCHYVLRSAGEEDLLRGLVKDAVLQGIRAWGGEEAFRKAVCRSQIMNANASMPIVQQEVSEFCKQ